MRFKATGAAKPQLSNTTRASNIHLDNPCHSKHPSHRPATTTSLLRADKTASLVNQSLPGHQIAQCALEATERRSIGSEPPTCLCHGSNHNHNSDQLDSDFQIFQRPQGLLGGQRHQEGTVVNQSIRLQRISAFRPKVFL